MMNIHFIAIGGAAMHNLAIALKNKGFTITGSDDAVFDPSLSLLKKNGLLPHELGWFPEKITPALDGVILGMHAKEDNPELLKAQELGLKIYSYPEFLFEKSQNKTRVVIAGSHGKTTITAMVLHVLHFYGKEADYMVGAPLDGLVGMVNLTEHNDFIILEGDEYLSSALDKTPKFLHYRPNIALISGIAWDHINVFKTEQEYTEQFIKFTESITPGGVLVYNQEDDTVKEIAENAENYFRKMPYRTPVYSVKNGSTSLETEMGEVPLKIFGRHNLLNLEGARILCSQLGILEEDFYEAMMSFTGAKKRLEKVPRTDHAIVYMDFAHAPSKVKATAAAFREQFPQQRRTAILELHTYSSLTPEFLPQFRLSLQDMDEAVVFYDQEALKIKNMPPISPEIIQRSFSHDNLTVFTSAQELQHYWQDLHKAEGAFLLMSSGHFGGLDVLQ